MRLRILRSVLLPAPFRPTTPSTSPCLDLEIEVLECPESLLVVSCQGAPQRP
jgi:hypothetical protein